MKTASTNLLDSFPGGFYPLGLPSATLVASFFGMGLQKRVAVPITGGLIGLTVIPVTLVGLTAPPTRVLQPFFMDSDVVALSIDTITKNGLHVNLSAGAESGETLVVYYIP